MGAIFCFRCGAVPSTIDLTIENIGHLHFALRAAGCTLITFMYIDGGRDDHLTSERPAIGIPSTLIPS